MKCPLVLAVLSVVMATLVVRAEIPQPRHVLSHDNVKVVTDQTKGIALYPAWALFPPKTVDYRKVVLYITYRCPDGQHCGEWDYIDNVYLRKSGGGNADERHLELARMISPYGWKFDSTWSFTWHVDVSDFSFLLHDSVQIEFAHGGYESNTDRGWLVTLDFVITEGTPPMRCVGVDTLWQGSFKYGDSALPFDSAVRAIAVGAKFGPSIARLRILQTGHGMDDSENCAEFCNKYRRILWNDSLVDQRQIWRTCGDNPLYPQAGTWLFNRANWCPGGIVHPDCYDLPIERGLPYKIDLDMEPYLNRKNPTANYAISAYLFYFEAPRAMLDVALEGIVAPSEADENARENPICGHPRVRVKNYGSRVVTSMNFTYGVEGLSMQSEWWAGKLAPQQTVEVSLMGNAPANKITSKFKVRVDSPNGGADEYPLDNEASTEVTPPPSYDTQLVVVFRTNHDSTSTSYQVVDDAGRIVAERNTGSLAANTVYRDTLRLTPGCYAMQVTDTAGDGLDFWFNPEGGYGYVRLLDAAGRLVKAFPSDFGSGVYHAFTVLPGVKSLLPEDQLPLVTVFPARTTGSFEVELFRNEPGGITLQVVSDSTRKVVYEKAFADVKEALIPIDIAKQQDGIYWLKAKDGEKTIERRVRLKREVK